MDNNQNLSEDTRIYQPGSMNTRQSPQNKANMQKQPGGMAYRTVYPEIFYKLQPHIMMACDQIDTYGTGMPTQEMIEQMTDSINEDICHIYPDIAEYARSYDEKRTGEPEAVEAVSPYRGYGGWGGGYGERFRRRGMFRDLIGILLLSEFYRRRRRWY